VSLNKTILKKEKHLQSAVAATVVAVATTASAGSSTAMSYMTWGV